MGFKEVIAKIMQRKQERGEPVQYRDPDAPIDRALAGYRRQRQRQYEEVEKRILKKEIVEYNRRKTRRNIFGIKDADDDAYFMDSRDPQTPQSTVGFRRRTDPPRQRAWLGKMKL